MTDQLYAALAEALPLVDGAKKDSENAAFKNGGKVSRYADLASVIEAIRPVAAKGIWFRQMSKEHERGVLVETFYVHKTGEMSAGETFMPVSGGNAQAIGSALTYARRYGLMAAFGIAPEDDDGNAAASAPPAVRQVEPVTINAAQLKKIQDEVDRTGTNAKAVCDNYRVPALANLNASQFADAMSILRDRPDKAPPKTENFGELLDDEIPNFGAN